MRIGMLGVDFEVHEPPELAERMGELAQRFARRRELLAHGRPRSATLAPMPDPAPHAEDVSTRWMWLGVALPIGFGAWVPLVAGYRARHRPWIVGGIAIAAFAIFAFVFSTAEEGPENYGGMLLVISWLLSGAVSFALRRPYQRRMAVQSGYDDRIAPGRDVDGSAGRCPSWRPRIRRRPSALGVGAPDSRLAPRPPRRRQPRAGDAIAALPGVSDALAAEIVALREELGGFDSVEDLGALMTLHPRIVDAMRSARSPCLGSAYSRAVPRRRVGIAAWLGTLASRV